MCRDCLNRNKSRSIYYGEIISNNSYKDALKNHKEREINIKSENEIDIDLPIIIKNKYKKLIQNKEIIEANNLIEDWKKIVEKYSL